MAIVILFFECGSVVLCAETSWMNRKSQLSEIIVNLATNEDYDSALVLTDSIMQVQPDNPYCPLLKATVLSARAIDFEDDIDFPAIIQLCEQSEKLVKVILDKNKTAADLWFYLGMIELYRSIVNQRQGAWFKSIKHVLKGGGFLEEAIKLDSSNWDIHYGLGMYKYYRSKRAGILRSLGLIADRRDEGINHIQLAAERGSLTRISARNSLAWIAYEKGNYDQAIRLSGELLAEFPGKRAFNWCLGKALLRSGRWQEAKSVFEILLISVRKEERNNHYNEIDCLHRLAVVNSSLHDWDEVIRLADKARAIQLSEFVLKKKKDDIAHLKQMREKAKAKVDQKGHNEG